MLSKGTLVVVFKDDESQETLVYSGETIVAPSLSNTTLKESPNCQLRYQPIIYEFSGTPIKFDVTPNSNVEVQNGLSILMNGRLQTLTVMDVYSHKSIDELRLEDYITANMCNGKVAPTNTPSLDLRGLQMQSSSSTSLPPSTSPLPSLKFSACLSSARNIGSSVTPGVMSTEISPASISCHKSKRAVRRQRVKAWLKPSVSEMSSNNISMTDLSTDISSVLPSQAAQPTFTPTVNFISEPNPEAPLSSSSFSFTPNVNFISKPDPACVFTAPLDAEKEPLSSLSVSEARQLRDALLESIVKCMQIQNSLYRLVLIKLQAHSTRETDADSQYNLASYLPKATSTESEGEGTSNVAQQINTDSQHSGPTESLSSKSAGVCLDDTSGPQSTVNANKSFDDASKASSLKSRVESIINDIPETSSVYSTGINPNDVCKASSTDSAVENLNDAPKSLSMESSAESLNNTRWTSSVNATGLSFRNDVPKASSTWRPVESLNSLKVPNMESSAQSLNDTTGTSSVNAAAAGVSLRNDVPKASSTRRPVESLNALKVFSMESTVDNVLNDTPVDSAEVNVIHVPKASKTKDTGKSPHYAPMVVLCELKEPLDALMRCADIQRSLFERLITINQLKTEEASDLSDKGSSPCDNQELHTDGQVDMLAVQSKLEAVTFKTKMECNYARNPFTNHHLKASSSEDVLQHISADTRPLSVGEDSGACSVRDLPHGRGTLETTTGEFVYSGDWCKGKRHGKGEGLILPFPGTSHSTAEHGFYIGGWKHNMRHGNGKMTFSSGAVYEGQWQFDKMTGYGTLKLPDGTIQEGTWKEGTLHGCTLFTWPHGVTEYREYDTSRGQLSSCKIEKEVAERLTQISRIRSQLLNLRDCVTELKDEKLSITEQLNTLKMEYAEIDSKLHTFAFEIRQSYEKQWERDSKKQREEFDNALKAAESKPVEEMAKLKKELVETKGALLCQICFERRRDCIILPCSHLMYCRACVAEHKMKSDSRCPTCRGPINSEILCNINHSS